MHYISLCLYITYIIYVYYMNMPITIYLVSYALQETLSVAEALGGQTDPLAGAGAGQGDHVLGPEEGDILCSPLLLRHFRQ